MVDPVDAARHAILRQKAEAEKMDRLFLWKTWDIVAEVHLPKGKAFKSPMGKLGRHGWLLRERSTGETICVGYTLIQTIANKYQGVTLPKRLHMQRRDYTPKAPPPE